MSINNQQIKLIHKATRDLGFDDETYREMLKSVAGVSSCKDLNVDQFREVMNHLQECGFQKIHGDHEFSGFKAALAKWEKRTGAHRPGMATAKQLAKIEVTWRNDLKWYWAPNGFGNEQLALRGFLNKRFGVGDLAFLKFQQAHACIEALKAIQERRNLQIPGEKE